jgi:hypothetical protein
MTNTMNHSKYLDAFSSLTLAGAFPFGLVKDFEARSGSRSSTVAPNSVDPAMGSTFLTTHSCMSIPSRPDHSFHLAAGALADDLKDPL